ncbi:unnamed protein product [Cylicocyclus nassatus]|uniref:Uncharacterized protein n=1 Tax=Cylicocyclus nassatus TaxID=53992 RepID=A0AA36H2P3_CYLNA|nr:unnamed protein product [Cylicocyclus nassatus]
MPRFKERRTYEAVFISNFTVPVDMYASSQLCTSFLITAPVSTFGWWLAFFSKNQNNVFYLLDKRNLGGRMAKKELFLDTWMEFAS